MAAMDTGGTREILGGTEAGELVSGVEGLADAVARLVGPVESPGLIAAATEFVLEGLHLNRRLNKERRGGGIRYAR
jgi:magnesium chelatase subunit I